MIKNAPWPVTVETDDRQRSALDPAECDARLLVLSTHNADKGQAADKDVEIRLAMMQAVAQHLNELGSASSSSPAPPFNVAVACADASTFAAKSHILKQQLNEMPHTSGCFFQWASNMSEATGWDTIIRFFAPRYYTDPERPINRVMDDFFNRDGSFLACARRGDVSEQQELEFLASDHVRPWRDRIVLFELAAQDAKDVSSTRIRQAVKQGQKRELEQLVPVEQVRRIIDREGLYR
ncbi:hypothetical protein OIV83_002400 [Microbotryomycetes sp. JL201]|nr:hypothetical protein OIV83_002400 [Microbotryomycetes sp. JL201]